MISKSRARGLVAELPTNVPVSLSQSLSQLSLLHSLLCICNRESQARCVSLSFSIFRNLGFPPKKKKRFARLFLFRIFPTPLGVRESAETREMRFQVVNCPSQVRTVRITTTSTHKVVVVVAFVVVVVSSFFVSLCLSLSLSFKDERIESKTGLENGAAHALAFSLLNQSMRALRVSKQTGFSLDELRVRLPIGLLRKMYQQSVHRAKRHRPLRETARHHSPRANRLKRSAKETLASEHRGRDSSAPIPNTQKHVDQ